MIGEGGRNVRGKRSRRWTCASALLCAVAGACSSGVLLAGDVTGDDGGEDGLDATDIGEATTDSGADDDGDLAEGWDVDVPDAPDRECLAEPGEGVTSWVREVATGWPLHLCQANDGAVVLASAGTEESPSGAEQRVLWVQALAPDVGIQETRVADPAGWDAEPTGIAAAAEGGCVVAANLRDAGATTSTVAWFVGLGGDGEVIWDWSVPGNTGGVGATPEGDFAVLLNVHSRTSTPPSSSDWDVVAARFDRDGRVLSQQAVRPWGPGYAPWVVRSLTLDDGGLAGLLRTTWGDPDGWVHYQKVVVRLAADGLSGWSIEGDYGWGWREDEAEPRVVVGPLPGGGVLVASGEAELGLRGFGVDGEFLWGARGPLGVALVAGPAEGTPDRVALIGTWEGRPWLAMLEETPRVAWQRSVWDLDDPWGRFVADAIVAEDGGVILATAPLGGTAMWIVKLGPGGELARGCDWLSCGGATLEPEAWPLDTRPLSLEPSEFVTASRGVVVSGGSTASAATVCPL